MIVKMIKKKKNLGNRMKKMQEPINKDPEELENKHMHINNTIAEIKNMIEDYLKQKNKSVSWKIKGRSNF